MRHAAKLESSPRLQGVLSVLLDGNWHSTRDLQNYAYVCAAGECMSELKFNGIEYDKEWREKRCYYKLRHLGYARMRYRLIDDKDLERGDNHMGVVTRCGNLTLEKAELSPTVQSNKTAERQEIDDKDNNLSASLPRSKSLLREGADSKEGGNAEKAGESKEEDGVFLSPHPAPKRIIVGSTGWIPLYPGEQGKLL